jgi:hypothetical protein
MIDIARCGLVKTPSDQENHKVLAVNSVCLPSGNKMDEILDIEATLKLIFRCGKKCPVTTHVGHEPNAPHGLSIFPPRQGALSPRQLHCHDVRG